MSIPTELGADDPEGSTAIKRSSDLCGSQAPDADAGQVKSLVDNRITAIRELVNRAHYVVDPVLVAEAILARCAARSLIAGATFRSEAAAPAVVRSFRRSERARSFRPCGTRAPRS